MSTKLVYLLDYHERLLDAEAAPLDLATLIRRGLTSKQEASDGIEER